MLWPNLPIPVQTLTHVSGQQFQSAIHYIRWEILEQLTEILWVSMIEHSILKVCKYKAKIGGPCISCFLVHEIRVS
jgi:hypothetical protein